MKKISVLLLAFVVLLCFQVGSVSAETPLNQTINKLLGISYKWGGASENGFDCSGFTMYVFNKFNIDLAHQSRAQAEEGYWVSKDHLRTGDLVFFNTFGTGISHVGIYLGNGEFAHSANDGVTKNKLSESYYAKRYISARRILWNEIYTQITIDADAQQAKTAQ